MLLYSREELFKGIKSYKKYVAVTRDRNFSKESRSYNKYVAIFQRGIFQRNSIQTRDYWLLLCLTEKNNKS
jgi:hypothetical protein